MAGLRRKLDHVVRLHEESKSAFRILESHIKAGLLEAEEIFASLSVPLMRLVDLKSKEMAVEGRSCTIVVKDNVYKRATFRSFDGALLSAGGEVQSAICRMAEDVRRPLLGFAREMKADGVAEASRRLMAAVVELEAAVARRGVELEEAMRMIQAEEEANRSARKRLSDCEREVRNLRQKVEAWEQGFCRSFQDRVGGAAQHHVAEKHQFLDDKLLWQLLKDGQKHADDFNRAKLISPLADHRRRTNSDLGAEEDHDHHVKHAGAASSNDGERTARVKKL